MVTAELALALPALVLVLLGALTVQLVVVARASCADAARAAARVAARGEADSAVIEAARTIHPRADHVAISRVDGLVTVRVRARAPGLVGSVTGVEVVASAVAADEGLP